MAKIIVIDPGHGGNDPGAVGNGLQEKELTLSISLRVAKLLRARGADVRLTRSDDRTFSTDKRTDLQARAAFANNAQADYFVSIHINAGGGTGFESYVVPSTVNAESGRRQAIVHREVAAVFQQAGLTDRGQKTANFAVLRETTMPAILLECGFIDRTEDANQLKNPAFLDSVAQAIAHGIAKAIGLPNADPVENPNSPAPANGPQPISQYYKDVVPGMEWAVSSVDQLYEWGIMRGDGQGNFRPTGTMTRLEAAVALHKAIEYVLKQMGK
jgi:N-acetylmuramoyl-L-alanine amidase